MDWNKSNTILIIAFIFINIFLLIAAFNTIFTNNNVVTADTDYINNVNNLLKTKNISINCEIPSDIYILPVLETKYEIIEINNTLVQNYLGKNVEAFEGVYKYTNENEETLEILNGKKIIYTIRNRILGEIDEQNINNGINKFLKEKNINTEVFFESKRYLSTDDNYVTFTQYHNEFAIDNSYMKFYFDKNGIYKFEMQRTNSIIETESKMRTIPAIEALTRLMTHDDINNKDIIDIKMTYYSLEDENWQYIIGINSDPTWKVIFSDGSQVHLCSQD